MGEILFVGFTLGLVVALSWSYWLYVRSAWRSHGTHEHDMHKLSGHAL